MSLFFGVALVVAASLLSRNKALRVSFYKWFGGFTFGIFALYTTIDIGQFSEISNIMGMLLLALLLGLLGAFVQKWFRKETFV
jgi:hypothetical protein